MRVRKKHVMGHLSSWFRYACAAVMVAGIQAGAAGLKADIEEYFAELKESFTQIARNPATKKTKLSQTDRFFIRSLKRHQTIHSLIRTNSKGLVICEIVRGETPQREYRSIAGQRWFSYISRNNMEYHGFLKEEGRYYLFWAEPVILTTSSGRKKFGGTVAAKVDIWDCFHKISADIEHPFLIRLNTKSLYSHKWTEDAAYQEKELDIPGVDRISVRYEEIPQEPDSATIALQSQAAAEAAAAMADAEDREKKPVFTFKVESYRPLIIAAVVLLAIMIFALIRLVMWVRYRRLVSRIDKEDIL